MSNINIANQVATLKKANNDKFNNVNARGSETQALYKKTVPAETYALFERAKAAHANMLENAPLFIGAVLAGNMVGLDACEFPHVMLHSESLVVVSRS